MAVDVWMKRRVIGAANGGRNGYRGSVYLCDAHLLFDVMPQHAQLSDHVFFLSGKATQVAVTAVQYKSKVAIAPKSHYKKIRRF